MAAKALKEPKDVNRGIHRIRGKLHFTYAQRILARLSDLDGGQCEDHKRRQNHVGKIMEEKPSAAFAQKILSKMSDLDRLHCKGRTDGPAGLANQGGSGSAGESAGMRPTPPKAFGASRGPRRRKRRAPASCIRCAPVPFGSGYI